MCIDTHCLCLEEVAQRFPDKQAFIKNENIKKSIKKPCEYACCLKDMVSCLFSEDYGLLLK